jgi:hypothetical protein
LLAENDPYLSLPKPDELELAPEDDLVVWSDSTLEKADINLKTGANHVELRTNDGQRIEHELQYKDSADGVNHYAYTDATHQVQADMSVNLKTLEFFYTETGMKYGKLYKVKTHGWLQRGRRTVSAANQKFQSSARAAT